MTHGKKYEVRDDSDGIDRPAEPVRWPVILMQASGFQLENIIAVALAVALLATGKIPAPLIVVVALAAGILI